MNAITDPKLEPLALNTGPSSKENKNCTSSTAAFHTIGPTDTTAIRIRGLGGKRPLTGKLLTNMYAMVKSTAMHTGKMISEKMTALQDARGTSAPNFSEGLPSLFLLYPVMLVRERRQYPIHELE